MISETQSQYQLLFFNLIWSLSNIHKISWSWNPLKCPILKSQSRTSLKISNLKVSVSNIPQNYQYQKVSGLTLKPFRLLSLTDSLASVWSSDVLMIDFHRMPLIRQQFFAFSLGLSIMLEINSLRPVSMLRMRYEVWHSRSQNVNPGPLISGWALTTTWLLFKRQLSSNRLRYFFYFFLKDRFTINYKDIWLIMNMSRAGF